MNNLHGLIIGRNPINNVTGNGKTMVSFLGNFSSEQLSEIYVSDLPTDYSYCASFLQIDEKKILKNRLGISSKQYAIKQCNDESSNRNKNLLAGINSNISFKERIALKILRSKAGLLFRSNAWKKCLNLKEELLEYIEEKNPDFIFYDIGNLPAELKLVYQIVHRLNIPILLYVSDDYVYKDKVISPLDRIYYKEMCFWFEKLCEIAGGAIVISEAMKNKYSKHISCPIEVAMNGCNNIEYIENKNNQDKVKLVYAGNLGIGRLDVLMRVAEAVDIINEHGIDAELEVYSSFALNKKEVQKLTANNNVKWKGSVYGKELDQVRYDADVLVHVESFKRKYKNILCTAISTKISECMMIGRPILVVAPPYAESALFLKRKNLGIIVNNLDSMDVSKGISRIIRNEENEIKNMVFKARSIAEKELTKKSVSEKVEKIIMEVCRNNRNNTPLA